eukprot:1159130-Pelagomonas_calceolata.AAC.6
MQATPKLAPHGHKCAGQHLQAQHTLLEQSITSSWHKSSTAYRCILKVAQSATSLVRLSFEPTLCRHKAGVRRRHELLSLAPDGQQAHKCFAKRTYKHSTLSGREVGVSQGHELSSLGH